MQCSTCNEHHDGKPHQRNLPDCIVRRDAHPNGQTDEPVAEYGSQKELAVGNVDFGDRCLQGIDSDLLGDKPGLVDQIADCDGARQVGKIHPAPVSEDRSECDALGEQAHRDQTVAREEFRSGEQDQHQGCDEERRPKKAACADPQEQEEILRGHVIQEPGHCGVRTCEKAKQKKLLVREGRFRDGNVAVRFCNFHGRFYQNVRPPLYCSQSRGIAAPVRR